MIAPSRDSFEEALKENISLYVAPPDISGKDFFQCTREVSIARFALNQQANAYYAAVQIWTTILSNISQQQQDHKTLTDVQAVLNAIESKSRNLIEASTKVTELLGKAINMDIDKAGLKSLLWNLPNLVKQSISISTGDDKLAEDISLGLNNKISEMMIALRFADSSQLNGSANQEPLGITFNELQSMVNSVPSQPT